MKSNIYVFLDSSIIIGAGFNFSSGCLHYLSNYIKAGSINLITNDIVVREVKQNIMEKVPLAASKIRNAVAEQFCLNELRNSHDFSFIFEDFREQKWAEFTVKKFEDYLAENNCTILGNDSVNLGFILDSYFQGIAPFENRKEKKNEFPDAIIISSLINFCSQNPNIKVYVVTKDRGWKMALQGSNICVMDSISYILNHLAEDKALSLIDIENALKNNYDKISHVITEHIIAKKNVNIDLEFEEIFEIYLKNIKFGEICINNFDKKEINILLNSSFNIVIEYDVFDFGPKPGLGTYYSHDLFRQLHKGTLNVNLQLKIKNGTYELSGIDCKDIVRLSADSFIKDLPIYCSKCECRIYSENDIEMDICTDCYAKFKTLV